MYKLRRESKGFTLIELLIVVAIIGIIAAIAIPNLLNAIQRGKQKRTMSDIRSIGTAIESYQVVNGYPPRQTSGDIAGATQNLLEPTYIKMLPTQDAWKAVIRYAFLGKRLYLSPLYSRYHSFHPICLCAIDITLRSGHGQLSDPAPGFCVQPSFGGADV